MAFSESLKAKIRKRADFSCCMCRERLSIEIHHIEPQKDGGQDTEDNAAPLCPTCHEKFGDNPRKQKLIRECRDHWYEICDSMFPSQNVELATLNKNIKLLMERPVQNIHFQLGTTIPSNFKNPYSFVQDELVHPLIIQQLLGWISDSGQTVTAVDLSTANKSNQFFGDVTAEEDHGRVWIRWKGEEKESFCYSYIATSPSGIHMVECYSSGSGSGIFGDIILLAFESDCSLVHEAGGLATKQRILLKTLGAVALGDRYGGEISYNNSTLLVGADEGWFQRGEAAAFSIPIL